MTRNSSATTSNLRVNGFKDYCSSLTRRPFFQVVTFPDVTQNFSNVAKRVTAIALKGMDFDFRDLDFLIQNSENFSANSKEAQQIDAGFGFLERAFTEKTKLLDEQHFVQSLIIIAIYLTASGKSAGSLAADWSRGFFMTK